MLRPSVRTTLALLVALVTLAVPSGAPNTAAARPSSAKPVRAAAVASLAATPTVHVKPTLTVAAVGDMMFSSAPGRLVASRGPRAPFTNVRSRLVVHDVAIGNLETALSRRGHPYPKTFTFRGNPSVVGGLKWAGFDLLAQGNNHAGDYGDAALLDTIRYLDRGGIAHAGAGANRTKAWAPAVIRRKGGTIAYLSFCQISPSAFAATGSSPGTAYTMNRTAVNKAIARAHRRYDYVIVSFHWGIEKQYSPTSRQVRDGRGAINAGAELVLSHHPHVIEGVEFYRTGLIAYSLGNFVFSPGSAAGRDSMMLHLTLSPKGVSKVSADPVYIGYDGRPVVKTGAGAKRALGIIKRTSNGRGTHVKFRRSVALLTP